MAPNAPGGRNRRPSHYGDRTANRCLGTQLRIDEHEIVPPHLTGLSRSPGHSQRLDQQMARLIAQWVFIDECLEVRNDLLGATRGDGCLELELACLGVEFQEPANARLGELVVGELSQRVTSPQLQCPRRRGVCRRG